MIVFVCLWCTAIVVAPLEMASFECHVQNKFFNDNSGIE